MAGMLSFSCSVISLVFLALTLLTYSLFRELRTISGVCTMCMVGVLFLAQAVFEFGAEQTEVAGLCVAVGVLAHYLWLSATFWMNACTFLMFYRLTFPLRARVVLASKSRVLAVTSVYGLGCPALLVGSALAANWGLHGDLGYGGALCYVKRAGTRRLGLALPIGCLVLANLALFLATVVRLRRGPQLSSCSSSSSSSSRDSRVGLAGCAKLSVLTGLSWLFVFLYQAVRHPAVEYVTIVLFGLYGVVVFLSFVLNKHVLALFRARFARKKKRETSPVPAASGSPSTSTTFLNPVSGPSKDSSFVCTRL